MSKRRWSDRQVMVLVWLVLIGCFLLLVAGTVADFRRLLSDA